MGGKRYAHLHVVAAADLFVNFRTAIDTFRTGRRVTPDFAIIAGGSTDIHNSARGAAIHVFVEKMSKILDKILKF